MGHAVSETSATQDAIASAKRMNPPGDADEERITTVCRGGGCTSRLAEGESAAEWTEASRRSCTALPFGTSLLLCIVGLAQKPMTATMQTRYAMLTHVGRVRARNEDACGADPELGAYVVCDGMGGAAGGEIAARETAAAFLRQFGLGQPGEGELKQGQLAMQVTESRDAGGVSAERLVGAVVAANREVYEIAQRNPRLRGMGTTLVGLCTAAERRTACVVHVGDSRCYRVRHGGIERLTVDHSIVEEQVRSGEITAEQARRSHLRNVITRVVGSSPTVHPEVQEYACEAGDLFLLCSDGLNRDLSDFDLLSIVQRHRGNLDHAARVLVDAANLLGGGDNITVLLLEVCPTEWTATDESPSEDHLTHEDRLTRISGMARGASER